MNLKTSYKQVEYILETNKEARDSIEILVANLYHYYYPELMAHTLSFGKIMYRLSNKSEWGYIPSFTTIIRNRARVQNDRPDLRGLTYNENKRNAKQYKKDLGYPKDVK